MKSKSEFGKGLVVCLAKFYQHFANQTLKDAYFCDQMMGLPEEDRKKVISDNPPPRLDYGIDTNSNFRFFYTKEIPIWGSAKNVISHRITLWANGASDHLYEIGVPKGKDWDKIRNIVEKLQNIGLDMGHGSGLMGTTIYTLKDVDYLKKLTEKLLLLIDMKIGLKADWGEW